MDRETRIPLFDLVACVSDALDLVSPAVVNHHMQVAYVATALAAELGLPQRQRNALTVAGALHDIGAFSAKERQDTLAFELARPHRHAKIGGMLLTMFEPFAETAGMVLFHHVPWNGGQGKEFAGVEVPLESHILHLADRIAVLVKPGPSVLGNVDAIRARISEQSGKMFAPELVSAFEGLAVKEYFWLDLASPDLKWVLRQRSQLGTLGLDINGLGRFSDLFRRLIDFRSHYTATHCSGVRATADALAQCAGFSERECHEMSVASRLHDVGKLAIPLEILEKPARLTEDEFAVMRGHVYHTFRILEPIEGLRQIRNWASFHQERLNGRGYPFHLSAPELPLGARLLAVADVFTAITEDRPYRAGMTSDEALAALDRMVDSIELDGDVVSLVRNDFDAINALRVRAQRAASEEYGEFFRTVTEDPVIRREEAGEAS
ncbi:MAG TPA: HD domain-containing protein [Candidatus Hydrogenedentes bacterium]|nr:HD domain-containing protein [Candidatus Hydrogenedentota bacterium]HIJ73811.1 HD domain-containing protein [Candidatus Hydrogenedentota bacterium]